MANILEEVQQFVADKLNADAQLSACPFLVENKKDIDYEIKNALGKQGIVGLVMTPKATFAGAFMDYGLAWQIDELEVDIVENVTVNRGKKNGYVTGQDAAMRLFDVMCPLSGDGEGQFNPVSYEEGEDGNLLVNKCLMKCLVHPEDPAAYTYVYGYGEPRKILWRGEVTKQMVEDAGLLSTQEDFGIRFGSAAKSIGYQAFVGCEHLREIENFGGVSSIDAAGFRNTGLMTEVVLPQIEVLNDDTFAQCSALQGVQLQEGLDWIQAQAFSGCSSITELTIPASVTKVGYNAFRNMPSLTSVMFLGKTPEQLHDLKTWGTDNYPWGIQDTSVIHAEL